MNDIVKNEFDLELNAEYFKCQICYETSEIQNKFNNEKTLNEEILNLKKNHKNEIEKKILEYIKS